MIRPTFEIVTDANGRRIYHCPGTRHPFGDLLAPVEPCPYTLIDASGNDKVVADNLDDHWRTMHEGVDGFIVPPHPPVTIDDLIRLNRERGR